MHASLMRILLTASGLEPEGIAVIVVAVIVTFDGSSQENVVAAANRVAEITRTEKGCISYEFFADINRRGRILLFEEWESEEAVDAHLSSPHLAEFRSALAAAEVTGREIKRYIVAER